MPPLTRQQTFGSVRSWWSNSNPNLRGPTINLHAAAKPLMKLLYNRQTLEFISTIDHSIPLSARDAEIYGSYLSCEYVSVSTKSAILEDLYRRAHFEHDALVVHAHIFDDILKLREGPMWDVHSILLRLTEHDATAAATCGSLVALLCDSDVPQVIDGALWVLFQAPEIKFPSVTTGVSVEVKLLDRLSDMLEDSSTLDSSHQGWILQIISKLVSHESTAIAVVEAKLLDRLLDMLEDSSTAEWDQQWILRIISNLASHESTSIAVYIFPMLENLVSHESTAMAVVRMLPLDLLGTLWHKGFEDIAPIDVLASRLKVLVTTNLLSAQHKATVEATSSSLVAIFCDSDIPQVVDGTLWLLSRIPQIKFPLATCEISVEAKLLDRLLDMLKDSSTATWRYPVIFQMISQLALHNESSAVAIVEANILNSMEKLLRSRPTDRYEHIFRMLKNLVFHGSTTSAVLDMHLYDLLATLWRGGPPSLTLSVINLLARIARWREGAEGVVNAKLLNDIVYELHSLNDGIRLSTCGLLRRLVGHESTVQAVVAIVPRNDIVALSSHWDDEIRQCGAEILRILDPTSRTIGGEFHWSTTWTLGKGRDIARRETRT
ncbi:armadillo-type protein [Mycena rebaudengoi]|nr:armadillo-type protein [Mycena rebaudengoi]